MSANRQSRRILSLVRQLTLTGLGVFVTTLLVVSMVLRQVRDERANLTAEQRRLEQGSDQLRHFAAQSRAEVQATLDSMEAEPDVGTAAINLKRSVEAEIASKPNPAVLQPLVELDTVVSRLVEAQRQADNWRATYEIVWVDLTNQITLNNLRDAVLKLRTAAHAAKDGGNETLDEQLAELARLVEALSGEEQLDALADLKDHRIAPLVDSVSRSIGGTKPGAAGTVPIAPALLDDVRAALFGSDAAGRAADGNSGVYAGGYYQLRRDALLLRRAREKLKTHSSSLFEDVETANAKFAKSAQGRMMTLAQQMETTLRAAWNRMLLIGGAGAGVFLWLAFLISRGITGQVNEIEKARAEAETGRQTTQKLMIEQQAAAEELKIVHKKLLEASRQAGMAEVATGVLHNVGNVLNSVNVSASVITDKLQKSRFSHLQKAVELIRAREADLGSFFTSDSAGKQIPGFLVQLAEYLGAERSACLHEMSELKKNIEHIKEIVSTQQAYAGTAGFNEDIDLRELLEDGLRISGGALLRHDIKLVREISPPPLVRADKHKVLQILINLISNAKHAMKNSPAKTLTVRIESGDGRVRVSVHDTGYGIAPENMTRIFAHGFTTKKDGHGFGLHSGALAARELGGSLRAESDGPGCGALFTLELPVAAAKAIAA